MLQAVTVSPGSIVLRDVRLPVPAPDQVVVEVKAAGICGSDVAIHRGPFPGRLTLPRVLGHEWSGCVIDAGDDVEQFRAGDRVVSEEILWCGRCSRCRIGAFDLCQDPPELGFTVDGAHATHILISERFCHRLPDAIDYSTGALVEPLAVAYNGINLAGGGVQPGQKVLVIGLGPIGVGACLWAAAGGAIVHAIETSPFRVNVAKRLGIRLAYEVSRPFDICELPEACQSDVDLLVEAAGDHETAAKMLGILAPRAKCVLLGHCPVEVPVRLETAVLGGLRLVGSCGQVGLGAYRRVLAALEHGIIDPTGLVTHFADLSEVCDVFDFAIRSAEYGKIQFTTEQT